MESVLDKKFAINYNGLMNRLQNISEIRTGYNFRSIANAELQTVYLVSAKDLPTDFTNINKVNIPSSYKHYLRSGDILVKSRGTNYEARVFRDPNHNHPYVAASTIIIVRLIARNYKPSYVAQLINSDGAQQFLRSLSSGQTVPILSPSSLGLLNCPQAPLEKQDQLEIITKTIGEYQITLVRYAEAGEKLTKALKTQLMKGVE